MSALPSMKSALRQLRGAYGSVSRAYQRVQLDGGDEHLLLTKYLERVEKKGQRSLFEEVAA